MQYLTLATKSYFYQSVDYIGLILNFNIVEITFQLGVK